MPFVSYNGLRAGCKGTDVLTRYPHGLFDEEEIDALLDAILDQGEKRMAKRERREVRARELV